MAAIDVYQETGSVEHYTPADVVEMARAAMGGVITLDPASCAQAQETVGATHWFGLDHPKKWRRDGYSQAWTGNVFLNPPGGYCDEDGRQVTKGTKRQPSCSETGACGLEVGHKHDNVNSAQKAWWARLAACYDAGTVEQAVFVCFSLNLLQATQRPLRGGEMPRWIPLQFPIFFPAKRLNYTSGEGKQGTSPPNASCIIYLPPRGVSYVSGLSRLQSAAQKIGVEGKAK